MKVKSFDKNELIYYEFTKFQVVEFAKQYILLEIMPAFCNPGYKTMELTHARLVMTTICSNGDKCDYTIYCDRDDKLNDHEEYVEENGYRRNKIIILLN